MTYCNCPACAQAAVRTQQPGTTPFNQPFVGRPLNKLQHNDTIRSFGSEYPHHLGTVTFENGKPCVLWDDRPTREPLTGAVALCMLREDELPSVPGAGLMPINSELVEMV